MGDEGSSLTVRSVLQGMQRYFVERGVSTPRLDAEILIAHGLNLGRLDLYLDIDRPLSEAELDRIRPLMVARGKGKPVSQITGYREFYSLSMFVDENVLTPRPETEVLVDRVLARAQGLSDEVLAVDFGTGSGNIAIALAQSCDRCRVVAVDRSQSALAVAARNVESHQLEDRVDLLGANGLAALSSPALAGRVDLLVSNPPYVGTSDLDQVEPGVRRFEPEFAYLAGPDPFVFYRHLARWGRHFLSPRGLLAVEVGMGMAGEVARIFVEEGGLSKGSVVIEEDLAGIPRVVSAGREAE